MTNFYLCCRFFIVGKTPYAIITSYHPFAVPATPEARQKAYGDIRVACCGKQRIYAAACQRHLKAEEPSPHVSRKVKMREWRLSDRNAGKRMDDDVNVKIIYQIKPRQQPVLQNPADRKNPSGRQENACLTAFVAARHCRKGSSAHQERLFRVSEKPLPRDGKGFIARRKRLYGRLSVYGDTLRKDITRTLSALCANTAKSRHSRQGGSSDADRRDMRGMM